MAERVIIAGGGIIGLSCAFEVRQRGYEVTLIEPGTIGGQASGAAAGMLAPYSENTEQPDAFFKLCRSSLERYPAWLARIEQASGLRVDWQSTGSLHVAFHEADLLPLRTRMDWQNDYGAKAELVQGSAALRELEPFIAPHAEAALYCPRESHVYAPDLVKSLQTACRRIDVELLDQAGRVLDLSWSGEAVAIRTERLGQRSADRLVVCAGAWSGEYAQWLNLDIPVHPIRGQICSYAIPAGVVYHMIFSSQAYWVAKPNQTLICGASEDVAGFDNSVTERGISRLTRLGPRVLPFLDGMDTATRWAGLRPATRDGRPLLGVHPSTPRIILAAGHYRNGILLSPVTAHTVGDLLQHGQAEIDLAAFAPERFTAAGRSGVLR